MAFWKDSLTREDDWFHDRMKMFRDLSHPVEGGKPKALSPEEKEEATKQANAMYGTQLFRQLLAGQREVVRHRDRLRRAYRRLLFLSTLTFFAGLTLLAVPVYQFFTHPNELRTAHTVIGAVGGAQVVALLVFSPAERIRRLMRETTQATILLEAFQYTVNLQLIRYKGENPHTIDAAVALIGEVAYRSAQALQRGAGDDTALATITSTLAAAQEASVDEAERLLEVLEGEPERLRDFAERAAALVKKLPAGAAKKAGEGSRRGRDKPKNPNPSGENLLQKARANPKGRGGNRKVELKDRLVQK